MKSTVSFQRSLQFFSFESSQYHGKKIVPQFPPQTAAGRKSELLSIAKEVGHGETERLEIHVLRTLEFFQYVLNNFSFSNSIVMLRQHHQNCYCIMLFNMKQKGFLHRKEQKDQNPMAEQ